jgi:aspartate/methionine/tyrosine aminotransferase
MYISIYDHIGPFQGDLMFMELPPFRHVEWINDRPAPKFDLAWSNIKPDWSGILNERMDISLLPASSPLGRRELIDHISEMYNVSGDRVLLTNGCSEANWLAYLASISTGSKVLVEKPIYTPLIEIPKAIGANVTTIKRRPPDFRFNPEELKEKLSEGCDLFVMQNLNNPTGKALLEPDLREISSILDEKGVPALSDEVYRDFAMNFGKDGPIRAFPSMSEVYERAMTTSSVTKVYGAGGIMGGWLVGPKRMINRARRLKIYSTPMVNHMANLTTLEILRRSHEVLPPYFRAIRENEKLVSQWAAGRSDVQWSSPDGCAVGFLMYQHDIKSMKLCEKLYNEKGIRVIPGEFFHLEKGFRISLAGDYNTLKQALLGVDDMFDSMNE